MPTNHFLFPYYLVYHFPLFLFQPFSLCLNLSLDHTASVSYHHNHCQLRSFQGKMPRLGQDSYRKVTGKLENIPKTKSGTGAEKSLEQQEAKSTIYKSTFPPSPSLLFQMFCFVLFEAVPRFELRLPTC
jgi:hypothetical protein